MTLEENRAIVRRFIDEIFVRGDPGAIDELVAPDFTPHSWGNMPSGREALKAAQTRVSAGRADASMTIDDVIAEGDKVAVRLTSRARHAGEFMGLPATGKSYTVSETHIFRIKDGRVVEHWRDIDMLSLMHQLGAIPAPTPKVS